MALVNDPRLYSAGNAVFNTQPHVQLYAQLKAREAAKEEAFDQYLRNLNKNINSAGLRNQERPIFEKRLADWQKFSMENRDKLKNPRLDKGAAELQFQKGYQELLDMVAESRLEEEKKKPLIEIATDPNKRDRLTTDILPDIDAHDAPIWIEDDKGNIVRNPNRKSFDVSKIMYDPKPFDQGAYFKSFDDIKRSELTPVVTKNPKDMTETITTTSVFTPEDKDLVATRAVSEYMNNKSFKKTIDELNPKDYNDYFKQNFGRDIENPADLAAAYTLRGLQQKIITQKVANDTFERQKALKSLDFAYDKAMAVWKEGREAEQNTWIADDLRSKIQNAVKPENRGIQKDKTGNWEEIYSIPLTTEYRKAFSTTLNGKTVEPDRLRYNPKDGTLIPVFFEYDKNGNPVKGENNIEVIDYSLSVPHKFEDAVVSLGGKSGVKQKNLEGASLYGKENKPSTNKTGYIYNGKSYTKDQIEKAAKQNNMTVEDYIKAAGIK